MWDSRTKYVVMSGDGNVGQNGNIKLDNKLLERVEQFKYLGTAATDRNSNQEEINSRLKSRNAVIIRCRSCVLQFAVQRYKH
jgi:hypothetical protein